MASFKIKGILSYPHIFQPRAVQQGDDPKYGVVVLVADNDPQLANVIALQEQEKLNGFPSGFPATGKLFCKPSTDYPGYHQISGGAKADQKPAVVDSSMQPIIDPGAVYAGAVAWVAFNTFVYNQAVNKGVSAGLNGVMLTGEEGALGRIDGRPTVDSMFGDVNGAAAPHVAANGAAITIPPNLQQAAPVAPQAPTPPAPPAPVAPAAPVALQMTAAAKGVTLEQYLATPGWTEELLIEQGLAIRPSFA